MPELDVMRRDADGALLRCLELAHESFAAGGTDRLQRTPIAHAELNALAAVDTTAELDGMTLWSSHRPCLMCAAACEFTGVGRVAFIAPDPSEDGDDADPDGIEPEIIALMHAVGDTAFRRPVLRDALVPVWPQMTNAASERRTRHSRTRHSRTRHSRGD